jgi:hypothetical protein
MSIPCRQDIPDCQENHDTKAYVKGFRQIHRGQAEHLGSNCWRVRFEDCKTLVVRADRWTLLTILPKDWQPPALAVHGPSNATVDLERTGAQGATRDPA